MGLYKSGLHNIFYHTVCPNKMTMFLSDVMNEVRCHFNRNGRPDLIKLRNGDLMRSHPSGHQLTPAIGARK